MIFLNCSKPFICMCWKNQNQEKDGFYSLPCKFIMFLLMTAKMPMASYFHLPPSFPIHKRQTFLQCWQGSWMWSHALPLFFELIDCSTTSCHKWLKGSVKERGMYLFRCDFSSCSESTEIWHAYSFCVKKGPCFFFHKRVNEASNTLLKVHPPSALPPPFCPPSLPLQWRKTHTCTVF